jgi:2-haloacid dehalogenase
MSIEAVVFDLGNVLVSVNPTAAFERLQERGRDPPGPGDAESMNGEALLHRFECGTLTTSQFYEEACAQARLTIGFDAFCEIYCDIFSPVEEMIEAAERVRRAGIPTYLFSNTSELHFSYISRRYDFVSRFERRFLSYELKCMKPHSASYEAVERGIACRAERLLYIDDLPQNTAAAARRGWQVIHHTSLEQTLSRLRALELL